MRQVRFRSWLIALVVAVVGAGCTTALPPEAIPSAPPPPPPASEPRQLVVAVDDLGQGFNPHLMSDLSPVSAGVASLVLPSVFRPGPDGAPALDLTVASGARVVSTAPFTVSYELALGASWSDNTPIAAEDFVYLWERMRREPGVVDAAGYRLITDVRSRAGGKAVDVVFTQRYPQWPRLFANLLPAHLLKDSPRGWNTALAESIPVSGGPFSVSALDRDRGQLVLTRNDHYWATPAVLDALVLRRIDQKGMLEGLRRGELPVAQTWLDQAGLAALRQLAVPTPAVPTPAVPTPAVPTPAVPTPAVPTPAVPTPAVPTPAVPPATSSVGLRLQPVAQPMVVQLGLRTDGGVFTDERIRRAVAAMLDRDALIAVGTGNGAAGVRVDSHLLTPTGPGYRPTMPTGSPGRPDPKLAEQLLTTAGYQRDAHGRWMSLDNQLKVTIGTPTGLTHFSAIAEAARQQLSAAGVDAQVVTAPGAVLYTEPTLPPARPTTPPAVSRASSPEGSGVPATPLPQQPGGPNPSNTPAPGAARGAPTAGPVNSGTPSPGTPDSVSSSPTTIESPPLATAVGVRVDLEVQPRAVGVDLATEAVSSYGCPPGMAGVNQPARNATGFCSAELQPILDTVLSTGLTPDQAATTVDPILWRLLPTIPLFQVVTTLASTPDGDRATGNLGPGPLLTGPLATATTWRPPTG